MRPGLVEVQLVLLEERLDLRVVEKQDVSSISRLALPYQARLLRPETAARLDPERRRLLGVDPS